MKKNTLLLLFLLSGLLSFGQDTELKNYNYVYKDNIRTVKFHLDGIFLSYPIINMGSTTQLLLSFDDLNESVADYSYQIVHCDKDWQPSDLDETEFLDGFNGLEIENYDFSFNTLVEYTHYELLLPNRDVRWMVSGNYLLHIFENADDFEPIITRRFLVAENVMRVFPDLVPASRAGKFKTHHEIDFTVNFKGVQIDNARREISATVLQNGNWETAIHDIPPQFVRQEDLLFDYQDRIVFPAGKEFRFLDIRTFRNRREGIADIMRTENWWDVVVQKESSRTFQNFRSYNDINGNFVIEHLERNRPDLEGDYAQVLFAAGVSQELFEQDVYLIGNMTDWQLREEFKMQYNPAVSAYVTQAFLKQGFYNYYYATIGKDQDKYTIEEFEGNWQETENNYTILVYFRPFGARYDRLVVARTFNSANF